MKPKTLTELLATQVPDVKFVLEPRMLSMGGSLVIYGQAETWKSWAVLDLATAVSEGRPWLVFPSSRQKVLLIQTELTEFMYQDRVLAFVKQALGGKVPENGHQPLFVNDQELKLDTWQGGQVLDEWVKTYGIGVVIIDCLYASLASGTTKDEIAIQKLIDAAKRIQAKHNTSVVIVHHKRKEDRETDSDKRFEEMTGTAKLGYWADTIFRFSHIDRAEDTVKIAIEKERHAKERSKDLVLKFDRQQLRLVTYAGIPTSRGG